MGITRHQIQSRDPAQSQHRTEEAEPNDPKPGQTSYRYPAHRSGTGFLVSRTPDPELERCGHFLDRENKKKVGELTVSSYFSRDINPPRLTRFFEIYGQSTAQRLAFEAILSLRKEAFR
ncbi:hypothetical protein [Sulfidibacter corallicola]|uniref:Uncharacterized protein n=1 Tax=Sulfidibacter corallicola TaxID=2818388 RepID=A0A8A4TJL7_SULCO|nr:hypothetical protein [Sulfidibacter corallicola]QTD49783.1 hypothetical protein J3U87_29725 [Sulfidibacter corallicola]